MKKRSSSQDAFFNLRVVFGIILGSIGLCLALVSFGTFSNAFAQAGSQTDAMSRSPEIVRMVGPVSLDQDLRSLPYIAPKEEFEEEVMTRYPHPGAGNVPAGPLLECPN